MDDIRKLSAELHSGLFLNAIVCQNSFLVFIPRLSSEAESLQYVKSFALPSNIL